MSLRWLVVMVPLAMGGVAWADDGASSAEMSKELRTVEQDVDDLKERVFRSKATLQLLKELVSNSATVGARVALWHANELGGGYLLESATYVLDGRTVFTKSDPDGGLDEVREIKLHEQALPMGDHTLEVALTLRGKGYRIFSYLRNYEFRVSNAYTFKVEDGSVTVVRTTVDSKGALASFVDRPDISFEARVEDLRDE